MPRKKNETREIKTHRERWPEAQDGSARRAAPLVGSSSLCLQSWPPSGAWFRSAAGAWLWRHLTVIPVLSAPFACSVAEPGAGGNLGTVVAVAASPPAVPIAQTSDALGTPMDGTLRAMAALRINHTGIVAPCNPGIGYTNECLESVVEC